MGSKDLNVYLIAHVSSTQSRPTSKCTQLFSHNIIAVFKTSHQFLSVALDLNCFDWPLSYPKHIPSYMSELTILPFCFHTHCF